MVRRRASEDATRQPMDSASSEDSGSEESNQSHLSGSESRSSLGASLSSGNGSDSNQSDANTRPHHRTRKSQSRKQAGRFKVKRPRQDVKQSGLLAGSRSQASSWALRERTFEKFRSGFIVLPVPEGVTRVEKARGYSLYVSSVVSWVIPESLLASSSRPGNNARAGEEDEEDDEDEEDILLTVGVHVSLFHAPSKRFFGNTWVSPEVPIEVHNLKPEREPNSNALRYIVETVALNCRAYFLSEIVDANCVGIVELVAYRKDPDSKATIVSAGCGWTILPLFAQSSADRKQLPTPFTATSSGESVGVFTRSPRVLWELQGPTDWQTQPRHAQCKFHYQLQLYEPLEALGPGGFMRRHELVGALEVIPGLKHGNLAAIDAGTNPKLQLLRDADRSSDDEEDDDLAAFEDSLQSFARMASLVPKTIQFEEHFTLNVQTLRVFVHLRSEIEANLIARLKLSRRTIHAGASSIDNGDVSARVLKLALHNGRCYRTRQHTIPLKVDGGDESGDDILRCATTAPVRLKGFVFHPFMAVVVTLQFTVHFRVAWPPKLKQQAMEAVPKRILPEDDVVTVAMASRVVVPSDGKKLFLHDSAKIQEGSDPSSHRVLHVDLLSGPACRPYTENPVYTPPDHVFAAGRTGQLKMKESISFADLILAVDGDNGKDSKSQHQPLPVAKTKDQPPPVSAAGHWAQKILAKADANSVLAQTLNALAQSRQPAPGSPTKPAQRQEQATSPVRPASPQKKAFHAVPTATPPQIPVTGAVPELSRASKALLMRHGFVDAHDTTATRGPKPSAPPVHKTIRSELEDMYKAHEIRLHFAAFCLAPKSPIATSMPTRVYLTFQFYRFTPTRTETLRLSNAFAAQSGSQSKPPTFLLMRESPANKPSLAIQFDVDTTESLNPLEPHQFASYLLHKQLYVDLWDADTLFQLGTCAIPLHELLRQGAGVKKYQGEFEVRENASLAEDASAATASSDNDEAGGRAVSVAALTQSAPSGGRVIGKLQVLLSNYGLKGKNTVPQVPRASETEPRHSLPIASGAAKTKHRVRARPLVDSNAELYRLLTNEGFYGRNPDDRQPQRRHRLEARSAGDATTLTHKEIDMLCELFRSTPTASAPNATRIACDLEGRQGLTALLSLRPPTAVAQQPLVKTSAPVKTEAEAKEDTVEKLRAHLKRVLERAVDKGVRLDQVFQDFDTSGDKNLSYEELQRALEQLGFKATTPEAQATLRALLVRVDRDGNGSVSYEEFLLALGISIEQNMEETVAKTVVDMEATVRLVFQRLAAQGIDIEELFDRFDEDKSGQLDMAELRRALQKCLETGDSSDSGSLLELLKEDALRELMHQVNQNGDDVVDYHEFLSFCGVAVKTPREREAAKKQRARSQAEAKLIKLLLRAIGEGATASSLFQSFDKNADGGITVHEFAAVLDSLFQTKGSLDTADIQSISRRFDADGDGNITQHEFKAFVDEICQARELLVGVFSPIEAQLRACVDAGEDTMQMTQFTSKCLQQWRIKSSQVESIAVALATIDLVDTSGRVSLSSLLLAVRPPKLQAVAKPKAIGERLREFLSFAVGEGADTDSFFSHFDPDGDGTITAEELKVALSQLGQSFQDVANDEIEAMVDELDADKNGKISHAEFEKLLPKTAKKTRNVKTEDSTTVDAEGALTKLQALLATAVASGMDIKTCFKQFDKDGDDAITRDEFMQVMRALAQATGDVSTPGSSKHDMLVGQVMDLIDRDRSGEISLAEFEKLFPSTEDALPSQAQEPVETERDTGKQAADSTVQAVRELLERALSGRMSLDQIFNEFDGDGDGTITRDELAKVLRSLPEFTSVEDEEITRIIDALDENNSGSVSKDELSSFIGTGSVEAETKERPTPREEPPLPVKIAATVVGTPTVESELTEGDASVPVDAEKPPAKESAETPAKTATKAAPIRRAGSFAGREQAKAAAASTRRPSLAETRAAAKAAMKADAAVLSKDGAGAAVPDAAATEQPADKSAVATGDEPAAKKPPIAKRPSLAEARAAAKAVAAAAKSTEATPTNDAKPSEEMTASPSAENVKASPSETEAQVVAGAAAPSPSEAPLPTSEADPSAQETSQAATDEEPKAPASATPPASSRRPSLAETRAAARAAKGPKDSEKVHDKTTDQPAVAGSASARRPSLAETRAAARAAAKLSTSEAETTANAPETAKRRPSLAETRAAAMKAKAKDKATTAVSQPSTTPSAAVQQGLAALQRLLRVARAGPGGLTTALSHFDKDESGEIAYPEFTLNLSGLGPDLATLGPDDALVVAKLLDTTARGFITLDDFEAIATAQDIVVIDSAAADTSHSLTKPQQQSETPQVTPRTAPAAAEPVAKTKPSSISTTAKTATNRPPQAARRASTASSITTTPATQPATDQASDVPALGLPSSRQDSATPDTSVPMPLSNFDCAYEFHTDPAVRSIEVKLRRAAIEAYSRGVFPLRIIQKFLAPEASQAKTKKRTELRRVEFLQVLMELGFSLLSDSDDEEQDDAAVAAPRLHDHLYARQLERLARYKHQVKHESRAQRTLVRAVQKTQQKTQQKKPSAASVHRFAQDKSQLLRVLAYYRDGHKKSLVYSLLRDQVTTSVALFPSFAALLFLELPFANPYPHQERFRFEFLTSTASTAAMDADVVTDSDEWQFYRRHVPLAFGDAAASDAVERDMIDGHREIVLDASDRVAVPVKLRWLQPTTTVTTVTTSLSLAVRSCTHGHTVALFKLALAPQPLVCHCVLRFTHPAQSVWTWAVASPRGRQLVCLDASVAITTAAHPTDDASIVTTLKCRVGAYPSLHEFYLVLYADAYCATVDHVWQVRIQAAMRVDVHAALGQTVRSELVVHGDQGGGGGAGSRHVRCVASSHRVAFRPAHVFALVGDAYNRIDWRFCAVDLKAPALVRVRVHLVDVARQELVAAWLLHVSLGPAAVTKAYELSLPRTQPAQKKIAYTNVWDAPQTVVLRSSHPHRLRPRDAVLQVPAHGQVYLRLLFPVAAESDSEEDTEELLLFVNDQATEQNEECLRFHVVRKD